MNAIQNLITLGAAVLAAFASILNLWWKFRDKADKINVAYGLIDPQVFPGDYLNVVNRCDYPVRIADYGYVMRDGRLLSIPQLGVDEPDDNPSIIYGCPFLEIRNASFETEKVLRDRPVGVYALTTSLTYPTLAFQTKISIGCALAPPFEVDES